MGTVNGFGTRFFGRGDRHGDGSYVATRWVVVCHVPVFPLVSGRVLLNLPTTPVLSHGEISVGERKLMVEYLPKLNWKQVVLTYGAIVVLVAWSAGWLCWGREYGVLAVVLTVAGLLGYDMYREVPDLDTTRAMRGPPGPESWIT
jgi:hypothetical protein